MPVEVSRRNVAKSTAWAVPALAVAASAPAMAASTTPTAVIGAAVCNLFYGTGTATAQTHTIYFQLSSSTGTIPAGSVITNQVCVSGGSGASQVPTTTYPANSDFTITIQDSSGNTLSPGSALPSGGCFNVVFTFNNAVNPSSYGCLNGVIWSSADEVLSPGSAITVTQNASVTGATSAGTGTLKYQSSARFPNNINATGRVPNNFTSVSGSLTCYPSVTWAPAMSSVGADDVVCYPSGVNITTARCAWNGKTCATSTTGLCTPPYKAGSPGQTTVPSMC